MRKSWVWQLAPTTRPDAMPKGQVSTSWFRLGESPFDPCHAKSLLARVALPPRPTLHVRFLKRLVVNKFLHFTISLSTLATCHPCQRQAEGRNGSGPSLRPTHWRAARRCQVGLTTAPPYASVLD